MAQTPTKPGVNKVKWWPPGDMTVNERLLFNAINNHDEAITTLATNGVPASTSTTTVISGSGGGSGPAPPPPINPFPGLGSVDNQIGVTSYTTQNIDNGAQIRLGDASAVAVTLNSALVTPYFTTLSNEGPSTVTATPSTGLVNGLASITIPAGSWVTIYFDGTNWEADSPGAATGGVNQIIAGTNITISPVGGQGAVTINGAAFTGSANHFVGTGPTPSVTPQSALDTGGGGTTFQIGTDAAFSVQATTGTTPGTGTLFTVNYSTAYATTPFVTFSAANAAAGGIVSIPAGLWVDGGASTFNFDIDTPLAPSTVYMWNFTIIG